MSNIDKDLDEALAEHSASVPNPTMSDYAPISAADMATAEAEASKEKQFGGRGLEAAAGSAASAATLGLSDVALRGMGVSSERLAQVRERSPIASGLGTAAGIVAPMLATGGASALAEGAVEAAPSLAGQAAQAIGKYSPINLANKAGQITEQFASDALKSKIRSKAAREILSKATGMAAEGALINEGNLVDETALGKADLTAQNVIASGGAGALLGAGFGTALGTAQASIPFAKKTLQPLAEKLAGYTADMTNPATAMEEISGLSAKSTKNILSRNPNFFDEAVEYTNKELDHGLLTSPEKMYESNAVALERNGKLIGQTIDELHLLATGNPELSLSREAIYGTELRDGVLKELRGSLAGTGEVNAEKLKVIDNFDELLERYRKKSSPMDLGELNDLRKDLQKIKYKFNGSEVHNNKADVASELAGGIRKVIDDTAKRVAASSSSSDIVDIAERLKTANKNFAVGSTLEPGLYRRMSKGGSNVKFMDIIEGAAAQHLLGPSGLVLAAGKKVFNSDIRRNFMILTDMQRQATHTADLIKSSVGDFINKVKKPVQSASIKALVSSGYSMGPEGQAPKNKNEAFQNISANLTELQTSPDLLMNRLVKSTARIANAAPAVANEMQQTLTTATQFLLTKLPKSVDSGSGEMFKRQYEPTTIEMAKFERYLQTVEHPLSVLDDLEKGTITSEHVEALKTVYPALYTQLQSQVLEQVASPAGQKMSYSKKVQLGILLDVPTDESLQSQSILALQSNFLPKDESAQPNQHSAVSQTGASKINMAERSESGTEKIANRS